MKNTRDSLIGYKDSFLFGTGTSSGAIPTMSELYASLSFTAEEKELETEFKSIAAKCDNSFSILRELCGIKQWVAVVLAIFLFRLAIIALSDMNILSNGGLYKNLVRLMYNIPVCIILICLNIIYVRFARTRLRQKPEYLRWMALTFRFPYSSCLWFMTW